MQEFENMVTIQRPVEEVFAFLADFENIPMWNYAIEETSKASAGPVRVGTRYRQTRSVPSRSVEEFEVTVFEPSTRLVNSVRLDPSPAMLRLLAPLATSRIKASVAQNLGKLTLVLEGSRR